MNLQFKIVSNLDLKQFSYVDVPLKCLELFSAGGQQILKLLSIFDIAISRILLFDLPQDLLLTCPVLNFVRCFNQLSVKLNRLRAEDKKLEALSQFLIHAESGFSYLYFLN